MAEISIFQDEAFGVAALLTVINEDHVLPGQIAAAGLFEEQGVSGTTVQIEKDGMTLALVKAAPRGSTGQVVTGNKRNLIPFNTVHLPETFQILADEIQGIRAVGSVTELMQVQAYVAKRVEKARRQLDLTHEFQRIGAIKGKVVDADGQSVLFDIFQRFGMARPKVFSMELDNPDTDVAAKCVEVLDAQEDALGTVTSTGAHAYCGKVYWAKFIAQKNVREAYLGWERASQLMGDRRLPFEFGGITWERYKGKIGNMPFVADDRAHVVPMGVPELFISAFAPADYMETVNTEGMPYYSKLEVMKYDKGVEGEAQSNPLHLCTRPASVRELTI
ncbi:MAG: major capsid protein [Gammaproteobacteria bacterium]|uniref:Putative capsid protein n=1 Tax=viral metagenome TaxID=1070528 RepID=A0A6M3J819_9ZZZZ|nr:major capsid protein [Gammaproteobacteria bacterium]MBU1492227.1 major capsid protein [Gammaproteobacteria bacterium]MBU2066798.1 major capsid protein [Gammaproteobacteria bacterium]MBU2137386.1 major capsid protein [Gammaproteobacteria bacterium]MBU2215053.1 major capsid protein [Gammaproteobacteria bacterium]